MDCSGSAGGFGINIGTAATTAGMVAAAVTFAAVSKSTSVAAAASGLTVSALGEVAGLGARALFGDVTGLAVKMAGAVAGRTTEEMLRQGGMAGAAVAAAATGAATALTVTVGGHAVRYTMKYGGQISKELAEKFAEMYVTYRTAASAGGANQIEDASGGSSAAVIPTVIELVGDVSGGVIGWMYVEGEK